MNIGIPSYEPDLFSEEAILEPYEHYRRIRELGPVVWLPTQGVHIVARFADVRSVLADAETFRSGNGVAFSDIINERSRSSPMSGRLSRRIRRWRALPSKRHCATSPQ